jgi:hypothetical protein
MSKVMCVRDRTLKEINKYYEINACWPSNRWLATQMGITITALKTNLRTLAAAGSIELDVELQIIGSASVRINWMSRPLLSRAA